MIGDDVNDRYYYQSNFANGNYGIWFCGTEWFIGQAKYKGKCAGYASSNFNTDKCVHNVGFDWTYSDTSVVGWPHAGEGLAVKCLYEPGNCRYSLIIKWFSIKKIFKIKIQL